MPHFPLQPSLARAGIREQCEYKARAVIDNDEVGISSDIVPVPFGGRRLITHLPQHTQLIINIYCCEENTNPKCNIL